MFTASQVSTIVINVANKLGIELPYGADGLDDCADYYILEGYIYGYVQEELGSLSEIEVYEAIAAYIRSEEYPYNREEIVY